MLNSSKNKKQEVSRLLSGLSGKNQLSKKLSAFIVTAMMFSASANAQIVYTDVNPDVTKTCSVSTSIGGGACSTMDSIDINNDGVFDLKLELGASRNGFGKIRSGFVKASPLNGSAIRTDNSGYPLYMNLNDVVDSSGSASIASGQILISKYINVGTGVNTTSGNWITTTDGFLGLKIVSVSQSYYCWVRLNVAADIGTNISPTSASFTYKDFAYNSIPNQPILAGDTGTGPTGIIEAIASSSINLFPNPATNHLIIALGSNNKKVQVTITDITGKIIYSIIASETQKIEVNTNDFAEGIYVVQIQAADFTVTKKLIVEK
jgi:hypothetical protein